MDDDGLGVQIYVRYVLRRDENRLIKRNGLLSPHHKLHIYLTLTVGSIETEPFTKISA